MINLLSEQTADGFVFRVDTRLRPHGDSGPLICSLAMLEQYFFEQGREWERFAWLKARVVADSGLGSRERRTKDERALMQIVLPRLYVRSLGRVWEPCAGLGHMSAVLAERSDRVFGMGGHENQCGDLRQLAQAPCELDAAQSGHVDVEQGEIHAAACNHLQRVNRLCRVKPCASIVSWQTRAGRSSPSFREHRSLDSLSGNMGTTRSGK